VASRPGVRVDAVDLNNTGFVVANISGADRSTSPATPVSGIVIINIRGPEVQFVPAEVAGDAPRVTGMNDRLELVGQNRAGGARWTPRDGSYEHEHLGHNFIPLNLNERGDLVGRGTDADTILPAVWPAGATVPTALDITGVPASSFPNRGWISETGVVVVQTLTVGASEWPIRWRSADAPPERFPTDGWSSAHANGMNDRGDVVATAKRSDGQQRAVRWS
jgi:hypothetical protein